MAVQEKSRPNPPAFAKIITVFAFLLIYLPLAALVVYSFLTFSPLSDEPPRWGLEWYAKALHDEQVLSACWLSLVVGFWTTVVASVLGTAAAFALDRADFLGKKILNTLIHVPLVMPEIVLGLSLLIWFVALNLTLGSFSIVLAHVTFSLSYVIITVRSRLKDFDRGLEEAARDLGATAWETFWRVTFPLIWPGVLSGALMAFTLSFDDFLITFFTAGVGSDTLPLKIYSMIKYGVSPEINALSTLMLGITLVLVLIFFRPSDVAAREPVRES
jgi:spermidine/putrescine transport system permease protein